MSETRHLIRRFFAALPSGGLPETDRFWVESVLSQKEYALWARQYPPDRRHSAAIARQVERRLADQALVEEAALNEETDWALAAALLHDIGKIEAGLGTWGRVFATIVAKVVGPQRARQWIVRDGYRGKVGAYLNHPEIGAELLHAAQSDPRTIAWAVQHHKPPDKWTIPADIARVLHEFDND